MTILTAISTKSCPCQSQKIYADCCQPYHQKQTFPTNAEALMRSRYSAYVLQLVDYIVETTIPSQHTALNYDEIKQWSKSVKWLGLRILKNEVRSETRTNVEFEAYFIDEGKEQIHHENSLFVKVQDRWYFIEHTRSLPVVKAKCLCGSGKKFKHCCAAFLR